MQGMPNPPSSRKGIYIGVVVVLILLGLFYWYFMPTPQPQPTLGGSVESAPALSTGNTTADIQKDLSSTPDAGAALDQNSNNVNTAINSL